MVMVVVAAVVVVVVVVVVPGSTMRAMRLIEGIWRTVSTPA